MGIKKAKEAVKLTPIEPAKRPVAVIFELETVVLNYRAVLFQALSKQLKEKGVKLSLGLFIKHCLYRTPQQFIEPLLAALGKRLSPDKFRMELAELLHAEFKHAGLPPEFKKLTQALTEQSVSVGCIHHLPKELFDEMAPRTGLAQLPITFFHCQPEGAGFVTVENWLKTLKQMAITPSRSMAIASSSHATRAALTVGMKCMAIPDSYTGFDDFSGVDFIIPRLQDVSATKIAQILNFTL